MTKYTEEKGSGNKDNCNIMLILVYDIFLAKSLEVVNVSQQLIPRVIDDTSVEKFNECDTLKTINHCFEFR